MAQAGCASGHAVLAGRPGIGAAEGPGSWGSPSSRSARNRGGPESGRPRGRGDPGARPARARPGAGPAEGPGRPWGSPVLGGGQLAIGGGQAAGHRSRAPCRASRSARAGSSARAAQPPTLKRRPGASADRGRRSCPVGGRDERWLDRSAGETSGGWTGSPDHRQANGRIWTPGPGPCLAASGRVFQPVDRWTAALASDPRRPDVWTGSPDGGRGPERRHRRARWPGRSRSGSSGIPGTGHPTAHGAGPRHARWAPFRRGDAPEGRSRGTLRWRPAVSPRRPRPAAPRRSPPRSARCPPR